MDIPQHLTPETIRQMRFAMRLSLVVGLVMLVGKAGAYAVTGSAAILSDAGESVIHLGAVAFAAFSLWLSVRPPNDRFPFGYERISFFSAGLEGTLIVVAAAGIIATAIRKWLAGLPLENLGTGTLIILGASILNAGLGWYLLRVGRQTKSLILEANGRHVLTDSWTSFGVVAGLGLLMLTGWKPFDPICAVAVALNILWSGWHLVWRSIRGLLDYSDPSTRRLVHQQLDAACCELGLTYHAVRCRNTGQRLIIHVHLLFPYGTALGHAHHLATELEFRLPKLLEGPAEVVTHLESMEDHGPVHARGHDKESSHRDSS